MPDIFDEVEYSPQVEGHFQGNPDEIKAEIATVKDPSTRSLMQKAFDQQYAKQDIFDTIDYQKEPEDTGIQVREPLREGAKDVARSALTFGETAAKYDPLGESLSSFQDKLTKKLGGMETTEKESLRLAISQKFGTLATSESLKQGDYKKSPGLKGYAEDVIRTAPQIAAQLVIALVSPAASVGFMGTQIAGGQIENLRAQGVPEEKILPAAAAIAAMQTPLEQIGISRALKFWTPGKTLSKAIKEMGQSAGTEFLTEWIQQYPELATEIWAKGGGVKDFIDRFGEATQEGLYQGAVAAPFGGVISGANIALSKEQQAAAPKQDIFDELTTEERQDIFDEIGTDMAGTMEDVQQQADTRAEQRQPEWRQQEQAARAYAQNLNKKPIAISPEEESYQAYQPEPPAKEPDLMPDFIETQQDVQLQADERAQAINRQDKEWQQQQEKAQTYLQEKNKLTDEGRYQKAIAIPVKKRTKATKKFIADYEARKKTEQEYQQYQPEPVQTQKTYQAAEGEVKVYRDQPRGQVAPSPEISDVEAAQFEQQARRQPPPSLLQDIVGTQQDVQRQADERAQEIGRKAEETKQDSKSSADMATTPREENFRSRFDKVKKFTGFNYIMPNGDIYEVPGHGAVGNIPSFLRETGSVRVNKNQDYDFLSVEIHGKPTPQQLNKIKSPIVSGKVRTVSVEVYDSSGKRILNKEFFNKEDAINEINNSVDGTALTKGQQIKSGNTELVYQGKDAMGLHNFRIESEGPGNKANITTKTLDTEEIQKTIDAAMERFAPNKGITEPIGKQDKINGITREEAGDMLAAGDEAILNHIREGVKKHGVMAMEDAIRNQEITEVAGVPKSERGKIRERIAKLKPQIDEILSQQEKQNAKEIRKDAGQIREGRDVGESGKGEGGQNIQRDKEAGAEAGYEKDKIGDVKYSRTTTKGTTPEQVTKELSGNARVKKLMDAGKIKVVASASELFNKESMLFSKKEKMAYCKSCDRFRRTEEGEKFWQEMMASRKEISEKSFLSRVDVSGLLDPGETWNDYIENARMQDDVKFYESKNGAIFLQTAGFEFIFTPFSLRLSGEDNVSGAYNPASDTICLVSEGIAEGQAESVLYHEAFHRAKERGEIQPILAELERYEKMAGEKGPVADWFTKAREAGQVDKGQPQYIEEIGAYAVQQYEQSPNIIKRWVDKLVAKVRMAIFNTFGKVPKNITPAFLREIALSGLKADVNKESGQAGVEGSFKYSREEITRQAKAFYSKLAEVSKLKFAGMKAQGVENFLLKQGVKKAEIEATGLREWLAGKKPADKVTKQELLDFVKANTIELDDVVLGVKDREPEFTVESAKKWLREEANIDPEEDYGYTNERDYIQLAQERYSAKQGLRGDRTHFSQYTEPGAEEGSYREMFVTVPALPKRPWNEASMEMFGKKYADLTISQQKKIKDGSWQDGHIQYAEIKNPIVRIRFNTRTDTQGRKLLFIEEMQGPSKDNQDKMPQYLRDNIYNLGAKRVLAYAKENGFGGVAWTTGEMQAARYDLSKQLNRLEVQKITGGPYKGQFEINGYDKQDMRVITKSRYTSDKLNEAVGKELSERIIRDSEGLDDFYANYKEVDLKVGGEGLKRLYDVDMPNLFKAYGKEGVDETYMSGGEDKDSLTSKVYGRGETYNNLPEQSQRKIDGMLTKNQTSVQFIPITGKTPENYTLFSRQQLTNTTPETELADQDQYLWDVPRDSRLNETIRWYIQDKFDPLRRVQKKIEGYTGEKIPDHLNALRKAKLQIAKSKAGIDRFEQEHVKPLTDYIKSKKLALEDVENYLYAKHVHLDKVNDRLRQINAKRYLDELVNSKKGTDKGNLQRAIEKLEYEHDFDSPERKKKYVELLENSFGKSDAEKQLKTRWEAFSEKPTGMTDGEARTIYESTKSPELEDIAGRVRAINEFKINTLLDSGKISKDEAAAWRGAYKHFVPLKREGFTESRLPVGRGISDLSKASKTRSGSTRRATNILANLVAESERAIVASKKAETAKTLVNLVKEYPNPDFWSVEKSKKVPGYDSAGNITMYSTMEDGQNIIPVKINGERFIVKFKEDSVPGIRIAKALKNDMVNNDKVIQSISKVTRLLAQMNTSWSPEFIVSNFLRDLQTAAYNISDTEARAMKSKILKDVVNFKAVKGIWDAIGGDETSEWSKWFKDFQENGAQVSWMSDYADVEKTAKKLADEIKSASSTAYLTKQKLKALGELVGRANNSIENAVRLSFYRHAVESGAMTREQAALAAKELTTNFETKGAAGQVINAFYMFANAGVQGSTRILGALKNREVQKMVAVTFAAGWIMDMFNRAAGGDDKDKMPFYDKIPDYVKERNMIIMLSGGDYIKIPMPWGYNLFWNIGTEFGAATTRKDYKPASSAGRIFFTALNAFNPIQAETIAQTISPTVLDPFVQIWENKSWSGTPLKPENSPFDKTPTPEYQMYWRSARPLSKDVAKWLNDNTGGNAIRPGAINISPEWIDNVYDNATGSVGRFIVDTLGGAAKVVKGEDFELREIPFARKIVGEKGSSVDQSIYHERIKDLLLEKEEYKVDMKARKEISRKYKNFNYLVRSLERSEKELKDLRKRKRDTTSDNVVNNVDKRMQIIYNNFNREFNSQLR